MSKQVSRLKFRAKTSGLKSFHFAPGHDLRDGDEVDCEGKLAEELLEKFPDYFFPVKPKSEAPPPPLEGTGKASEGPHDNKSESKPVEDKAFDKGKK